MKEEASAILVWSLALALDHAWAYAWEPGMPQVYGDPEEIRALPIYGKDYPRAIWTPEGREALQRFTEHWWGEDGWGEDERVIPVFAPEVRGHVWAAKTPWGRVEVCRDGAVDLWVREESGEVQISTPGLFSPVFVLPASPRPEVAQEVADFLQRATSSLAWCLSSEGCGRAAMLAANTLANLWGAVVYLQEEE